MRVWIIRWIICTLSSTYISLSLGSFQGCKMLNYLLSCFAMPEKSCREPGLVQDIEVFVYFAFWRPRSLHTIPNTCYGILPLKICLVHGDVRASCLILHYVFQEGLRGSSASVSGDNLRIGHWEGNICVVSFTLPWPYWAVQCIRISKWQLLWH